MWQGQGCPHPLPSSPLCQWQICLATSNWKMYKSKCKTENRWDELREEQSNIYEIQITKSGGGLGCHLIIDSVVSFYRLLTSNKYNNNSNNCWFRLISIVYPKKLCKTKKTLDPFNFLRCFASKLTDQTFQNSLKAPPRIYGEAGVVLKLSVKRRNIRNHSTKNAE